MQIARTDRSPDTGHYGDSALNRTLCPVATINLIKCTVTVIPAKAILEKTLNGLIHDGRRLISREPLFS
jgi:hypothetical protein